MSIGRRNAAAEVNIYGSSYPDGLKGEQTHSSQFLTILFSMTLTTDQVQIIRSTVPVLAEHGNAITTSFYSTIMSENPTLNNIFNRANQDNGHQANALAGALFAYASNIDDLGVLAPAVERICHKHASLYVKAEHYNVVGEYLLRAMGDVLGKALTPEILAAWEAAYWQLANLMIAKEAQLKQRGWSDWRDFSIARKVRESDLITSFYLEPTDGKLPLPAYMPGQYISVMTNVPKLSYLQPRQYTLSDSPSPDYYRISVRKEEGIDQAHPGYISNVLHDHKEVGDVLSLSYPSGPFGFEADGTTNAPIVLISAGVGITPMMSILNSLIEHGYKQRISFIHGARTTSVQAFGKHIDDIVAKHPNVRANIFIKTLDAGDDQNHEGYRFAKRVDLGTLDNEKDLVLDDKNTKYFICGPQGFMADTADGLKARGVDQARINMETFGVGGLG